MIAGNRMDDPAIRCPSPCGSGCNRKPPAVAFGSVMRFATPWSPLDVATLMPPNNGGIRRALSSSPLVPHLAQRLAPKEKSPRVTPGPRVSSSPRTLRTRPVAKKDGQEKNRRDLSCSSLLPVELVTCVARRALRSSLRSRWLAGKA